MKTKHELPLVRRYTKNPILTRDDVPYPVGTIHKAGVVKHGARYIMPFRSHTHNGRSIIGKAESLDGFAFKVHPEPFLVPAASGVFSDYEEFGVDLDFLFPRPDPLGRLPDAHQAGTLPLG